MVTAKRSNWQQNISKFIGRIFGFIRLLIHAVWEIISHIMSTVTFFFSLLIKVVADPSTPCVVAIVFFMLICGIAAFQWWAVGVWLGQAMGFGGTIGGLSSGFCGMLLGLGLNVYQLSPQLWKLRRDVARAYQRLNVKTDHEAPEKESVHERQQNWHSYDHSSLKANRLIAYGIEAALIILYCAMAEGFAFIPLVQAIISLTMPERAIGAVSSTISLLGDVSSEIHDDADEPAAPGRAPGREYNQRDTSKAHI